MSVTAAATEVDVDIHDDYETQFIENNYDYCYGSTYNENFMKLTE